MNKILYIGTLYGSALLQFLLMPLFVEVVGKASFGEYIFYFTIVNWLAFASTLGTQTKIRQLFVLGELKKLKVAILISFSFTFTVAILSFFFLFFYLNYSIAVVIILVLLTIATSYISLVNAFLIADDKIFSSALNQLFFSVIPVGVYLILCMYFTLSYSTRFVLSITLAFFILYKYYSYFSVAFFNAKIKAEDFRASVKDNVKIGVNSLFDKIISQGDKLAVGWIFGFEVLAIYAIGSQISNVLQMTLKAFFIFLEQKIFKKSEGVLSELLLSLFISLIICFLIYMVINSFFLVLFDEEYLYVLNILPFQFVIVYLRSISGVQFTMDLVSEQHKRNVIVQYFFLILVLIYIYTDYRNMDIILFVKIMALMSLLSNVTNFSLRWLKK
ncbi:lipopolysaccharide biosynthesis protein [Pseudoalteromonas fuliginea]|uniref:lipopolysaccharide biosynthesis protein n=1 Tax=Pseudoalteromonas fuliginea TaxID=1872678 RepID=UPI00316D9E2B